MPPSDGATVTSDPFPAAHRLLDSPPLGSRSNVLLRSPDGANAPPSSAADATPSADGFGGRLPSTSSVCLADTAAALLQRLRQVETAFDAQSCELRQLRAVNASLRLHSATCATPFVSYSSAVDGRPPPHSVVTHSGTAASDPWEVVSIEARDDTLHIPLQPPRDEEVIWRHPSSETDDHVAVHPLPQQHPHASLKSTTATTQPTPLFAPPSRGLAALRTPSSQQHQQQGSSAGMMSRLSPDVVSSSLISRPTSTVTGQQTSLPWSHHVGRRVDGGAAYDPAGRRSPQQPVVVAQVATRVEDIPERMDWHLRKTINHQAAIIRELSEQIHAAASGKEASSSSTSAVV